MGSNIFKSIIERKIDVFVSMFGEDSASIFRNENNKLIHPGEYGAYRERCLKQLIEFALDKDLSVSDGFLITSTNKVSTQCDVIIYESNVTPLIDNEIANFFPVEIVKSIGEVKSDLSISELKEALKKLAENKKLFHQRIGKGKKGHGFMGEYEHPFSFLVCKKIKSDISKLNFNEIYGDVERQYWHNAILSIEDGLVVYTLDFNKYSTVLREVCEKRGMNCTVKYKHAHPLHIAYISDTQFETYENDVEYLRADPLNPYKHVVNLLTIIQADFSRITTHEFDFVAYLDLGGGKLFL